MTCSGPEFTEVEQPLIDQLIAIGWKHTTGNLDHPSVTGRESFREVLLLAELRQAIRAINLDPKGKPWLDEGRINQAVNALQRPPASNLLEANRTVTELLQKGTVVEGVPGWDEGRGRRVHYIDWDNPENNTFRVINQFRVRCPTGQSPKHIDLDLVLFVNGIPLVEIECKRRSDDTRGQLEEAVDQLQRYANRRRVLGIVDCNEGNEQLFHYSQFLIATCYDDARVGTFTAQASHYLEWKDTSPVPKAEVAAALKKGTLSSQETLVAGMLQPSHLLDIVQHFTLFLDIGGKTIKAVCRYQQFRAVQLAIHRILQGKTRKQDGEYDRRGGIIWHTQGSGKSLTMVFLVRKMRSRAELRRFKIVVVTDRKSLEKQIRETAIYTDEPATPVSSVADLKKTLALPGKDLVFAMIQKYRGEKIEADDDEELELDETAAIPAETEPLPELNADEAILVLVDEAHRSHASGLHANLLNALPNCARIGFTGTPIIMGKKKKTHQIFGDFIDRYTLKESEDDGATVKVLYEGRTTKSAVEGGGTLDKKFEDMLAKWTPQQREQIKQKYGTKGNVMEARALIAAKATDMLRHYVANIMPNGFKAQVVAVSRRATVRYHKAFLAAKDELVRELEGLDLALLRLSYEQADELGRHQGFLVRAYPWLETIKALEFAPVISGRHNDTVDPDGEWTDRAKSDTRIARFKKPLFDPDPSKADPLAFLIVKSMLLTGFDAPVEQAMYLDRNIQEAELLQAVARVNRTCSRGQVEKAYGIVVDYYGVARHLHDALKEYSREDVAGTLVSMKDEIPRLRDRHARVLALFSQRGLRDLGRLAEWERKELTRRFACWRHPRVSNLGRTAGLGDGSPDAVERVLDALDRLLLAPTPGGDDPYRHIHEKTVNSVKAILSTVAGASQIKDATEDLLLQVEPFVCKLLAVLEPDTYRQLAHEKRGLATAMIALAKCGRSRYTLKLSDKEFKQLEGWQERTSYENAVRDVLPARLDVAHRGAINGDAHLWESTLALMLGLIDHNLDSLQTLPKPARPEVSGQDDAVNVLRDEHLRTEFHVKLKQFLASLDTVLPRPEALAYINDARVFGLIHERSRQRYRTGDRLIGKEVGEKVRKLIDEHVVSCGIDPKIPPISITDAKFDEHVNRGRSPEARASEMEHALRYHIRQHFDEDPSHFEKLSKRLEGILKDFAGRWDALIKALKILVDKANEGRQVDETGLDPETQAPFYDLLRQETVGQGSLPDDLRVRLCGLTRDLVGHISQELQIVNFWSKTQAQESLKSDIFQLLDDADVIHFEQLHQLTARLMELTKANHHKLTR